MLPNKEEVAPARPRRKIKGRTVNTAGKSSLHKRLTKQLDGILAHLQKNPGDTLSQARVAKIKSLLTHG